jgi:hypothetical protein
MKVFISWSGTKSQKVAMVLKEWLPSVIQSLEPYVSSEDIDKGARWSTDIATELENSSFGILCVTRDNLNAPWISFEAGALSKSMDKSFVTPFLFDIKRSEVNGPILQFQSTIFEREDIKKLICTLNKACEDSGIPESRLDSAFEVWYPRLEEELKNISNSKNETDNAKQKEPETHNSAIMEEMLNLSRDNQKLLRNSDIRINNGILELSNKLDEFRSDINKTTGFDNRHRVRERRIYREVDEYIFNSSDVKLLPQYGFMILLNTIKNELPWIHYAGLALLDILDSKMAVKKKTEAIDEFKELVILSSRSASDSYIDEYLHRIYRYAEKMIDESLSK